MFAVFALYMLTKISEPERCVQRKVSIIILFVGANSNLPHICLKLQHFLSFPWRYILQVDTLTSKIAFPARILDDEFLNEEYEQVQLHTYM